MTIKNHDFTLLDEFKQQERNRALKVFEYQTSLDEAKARLAELGTQYEHTFTQAVAAGEDKTEELQKIDDNIALQKEVVARRERDYRLAVAAIPQGKLTTVDVVEKYTKEFVPMVSGEFDSVVNPKLRLARDLLISVIDDAREGDDLYNALHEELVEMSIKNRHTGKTSEITSLGHPTRSTKCLGRIGGAMNGVREVLDQVSKYTHGIKPYDYKYIEQAPKTNEKVGK